MRRMDYYGLGVLGMTAITAVFAFAGCSAHKRITTKALSSSGRAAAIFVRDLCIGCAAMSGFGVLTTVLAITIFAHP